MDLKELTDFFDSAEKNDFCVIVVEKKTLSTEKKKAAMTEDYLLVCKRQLDASNQRYCIDMRGSVIYCILNYSREVYSIRAFAGQFRQVICNIDTSERICVYYSEAFSDHNALFDELFYMLGHTEYGLFWGRTRTVTSAFMHLSDELAVQAPLPDANRLSALLKTRDYDACEDILIELSRPYTAQYNEVNAFSLASMHAQLHTVFGVLQLFFKEREHHCSFTDMTMLDLLTKTNGASGFIRNAISDIREYASGYADIAISERKRRHMEDIIHYIDENLHSVSLTTLSSHFGLTQEYISRLFKTQYAVNFSDYLKQKRLDRAVFMLRTGYKGTVTDLAKELGYQSRSYFQNIFKQEYGITPDAYRLRYRMNDRRL